MMMMMLEEDSRLKQFNDCFGMLLTVCLGLIKFELVSSLQIHHTDWPLYFHHHNTQQTTHNTQHLAPVPLQVAFLTRLNRADSEVILCSTLSSALSLSRVLTRTTSETKFMNCVYNNILH
jgi:hypothetical protein